MSARVQHIMFPMMEGCFKGEASVRGLCQAVSHFNHQCYHKGSHGCENPWMARIQISWTAWHPACPMILKRRLQTYKDACKDSRLLRDAPTHVQVYTCASRGRCDHSWLPPGMCHKKLGRRSIVIPVVVLVLVRLGVTGELVLKQPLLAELS